MNAIKFAAAAILASSALTGAAVARDQVQIAGSSTVLPYASIVAEAFGENFEFPTPVVESGGSGAGRKKLCEGVGENTIDIANSSSRIKQSDIDLCASNGVTEIQEVRIGYDGIVFASDINGPSSPSPRRTGTMRWQPRCSRTAQLVDNPYKTWNEIRADLPARKSWPSFPAPSTAPAKSSTRR
jgi:phosphate transport system substrate-binding protein